MPCRPQSIMGGSSADQGGVVRSRKLKPGTVLSLNSELKGSSPESMTATTTPAPLVTGQQGRTFSASMAHCDAYSGSMALVNRLSLGTSGTSFRAL